jgi:hypothetical protein
MSPAMEKGAVEFSCQAADGAKAMTTPSPYRNYGNNRDGGDTIVVYPPVLIEGDNDDHNLLNLHSRLAFYRCQHWLLLARNHQDGR